MRSFFALLMLGFMLILVAPVQAMQSGSDCNYSYNIDNANAPPGFTAIFVVENQNCETVFVHCIPAIAPSETSGLAHKENQIIPGQYAATARNGGTTSKSETLYSELALLMKPTGNEPYRQPRDGL